MWFKLVLSSNFGALREQGLDGDNCCRNRLFAYKCINVFLYLVPTIDVDPGDALEKKTNGAAIAVSIVAALLVAVIIITVMVLVAWAGDHGADGGRTPYSQHSNSRHLADTTGLVCTQWVFSYFSNLGLN